MSRYPELFRHLENHPTLDMCGSCFTIVDRNTDKRNIQHNNEPLCDKCYELFLKDELSW